MDPRPKGYGRLLPDPLETRLMQRLDPASRVQDPTATDLRQAAQNSAAARAAFLEERLVRISKGFYAGMPGRNASYVDITDEAFYLFDPLTNPIAPVCTATVPPGQVWLIDDVRFFARSTFPFQRLLDAGEFEQLLGLYISITGSWNIVLRFDAAFYGLLSEQGPSRFPFVNENIGATGTKFGIWALEGESIQAWYQKLYLGAPAPAAQLSTIGFRMRGYQGGVAEMLRTINEQA